MEKIFTFGENDYKIISEINKSDWEEKITDVTRKRTIFAWRPWWVGNKFRWFKIITLKERLSFTRYTSFDDGLTYQNYWGYWDMDWNAEKIID